MQMTVMTYNVHSCRGIDGEVSPTRIAEVIMAHGPDIVALQELDFRLTRTLLLDQAQLIAQELDMHYHFHPSFYLGEGGYGNAVLSRYPARIVKADALPTLEHKLHIEPRGILWMEVQSPAGPVQVFNTHLGLGLKERSVQIDEILSERWLGCPDCRGPVVFCADLNSIAHSRVYRHITRRLDDAWLQAPRRMGRGTFPVRLPLLRLDYIFVSSHFRVGSCAVSPGPLARRASDHRPLVISATMEPEAA